jgi:putative ABC transport system substrate-binding protein
MSFAVLATAAWAQQKDKVVIGVLTVTAGRDDPIFEGLWQGLRELGYEEGRNFRVEFRTAQGHNDRLPQLARELIQREVDVIVVLSTVAAQVLKRATSTTPIVMAVVADPVGSGLVSNFARPGGNLTGLSSMSADLIAKRLQLLKETVPGLSRVSVLWSRDGVLNVGSIEVLKAAALSLSMELNFVEVQTREDIGPGIAAVSRANVQALCIIESAVFYINRATLAKLAMKARLPAIYGSRSYAEEGGLISYGVDYADRLRRAAEYVDKILKGAKPGDLPIEQPTMFELVVNLKTAKALGITIPQSILLRADEVIR